MQVVKDRITHMEFCNRTGNALKSSRVQKDKGGRVDQENLLVAEQTKRFVLAVV